MGTLAERVLWFERMGAWPDAAGCTAGFQQAPEHELVAPLSWRATNGGRDLKRNDNLGLQLPCLRDRKPEDAVFVKLAREGWGTVRKYFECVEAAERAKLAMSLLKERICRRMSIEVSD